MLEKFLKEVVILIVGKQSEVVAELLDDQKYVNEFLIAKKLDSTINQTRNILYKLSDYGLVSSIRKKDKRKGWYTYFWKLESLKCLEFLRQFLEKEIEQINSQIRSRETKQFYVCEKCNIEFNEENALLRNFTCNECGGVFALKDNTKLLRELRKQLERIKREVALVDEEILKEKNKLDKKKEKEIQKEKKLKEKLKPKVLKKQKKLVKKKLKKISKKSIKKKVRKKIVKKKIRRR